MPPWDLSTSLPGEEAGELLPSDDRLLLLCVRAAVKENSIILFVEP